MYAGTQIAIEFHFSFKKMQEHQLIGFSFLVAKFILKGTGTRDLIWLKVVSLERS